MPSPSDLRCQAAALRYAARTSRKRSIVTALLARARRLEAEAVLLEHGGDKLSFNDVIGPPKPLARF
jgi:predicted SpoU family rRNA methylase